MELFPPSILEPLSLGEIFRPDRPLKSISVPVPESFWWDRR